ncbi:MAG TPA: DNA internalization-related competence protein ComEC/Rec2 [Candidatus Acidoferrales bacterium]|nr:DNA internalization-related competence protein ComEC/Rec2 [Candidatus Acidoferrales bacterium]
MNRLLLVAAALALVTGTQAQLLGYALPVAITALLASLGLYRVPFGVRVCVLVALGVGMLNAQARGLSDPAVHAAPLTAHGIVTDVTDDDGLHSLFTLRTDEGLRLSVDAEAGAPPLGARVTVHGRLEPFDDARNPGEPSQRALEAERGLDARLEHVHIRSVQPPDARDPRIWLPLARAWASGELRARMDEPYASILAGALWGERSTLPPDLRAEFQDTGTVHILVTAGLHLGVIAALTTLLLNALGAGRITSSLVTIAVIWVYAAFSGAHLPSLRAATMVSFGLLARAAGREAISWNALAAAAIVIALGWPRSIGTISFALSFSCVGAILLFATPIARRLERFDLPHGVNEALALTLATQIGTWPLTAATFLVFAPYAPLANLLVVPVVGVAMLLGIAQLLASPLGPVAQGIANINESLLMWIVGVVHFTSSLPGAHIVTTPPPLWTIAIYDATLLALAWLTEQGRVRWAVALLACACALVIWPPRPARNDLTITAIDVGQADALLIQTPRGHAFLVDAGGRLERGAQTGGSTAEEIGERIVVPFLIRSGVHHLDAVLLSHPHGDHAGGIAPVLRTLGADAFADSGQVYPGDAYHDALRVAHAEHIPLLEPRGGDVWHTDDGVTFRFFGPTMPYLTGTRSDINSNSLVFKVEYGRFAMLFTGDAGAESEQRMLALGYDVHADVLKVGHHGSAYSSTPQFIAAVAPRDAVISVGRDNLFGHPAPVTLQTLRRFGAQIYRTDLDGAITIDSDGSIFHIRSLLSPTPNEPFESARENGSWNRG